MHKIARALNDASRVLVAVGAGVSTGSGVPDFRSPGSGLYHNLGKYNQPYENAIFDINYYSHLHKTGKLLRVYTQNVDELELKAGLPEDKVFFAHGSLRSAHCMTCKSPKNAEEAREEVMKDKDPKCDSCGGLVRFDVVLYGEGEEMPDGFDAAYRKDCGAADFLICMGTSLNEYPFADIIDAVPANVPRLLMNRERVGNFGKRSKDFLLLGELSATVPQLAEAMGCGLSLR